MFRFGTFTTSGKVNGMIWVIVTAAIALPAGFLLCGIMTMQRMDIAITERDAAEGLVDDLTKSNERLRSANAAHRANDARVVDFIDGLPRRHGKEKAIRDMITRAA